MRSFPSDLRTLTIYVTHTRTVCLSVCMFMCVRSWLCVKSKQSSAFLNQGDVKPCWPPKSFNSRLTPERKEEDNNGWTYLHSDETKRAGSKESRVLGNNALQRRRFGVRTVRKSIQINLYRVKFDKVFWKSNGGWVTNENKTVKQEKNTLSGCKCWFPFY